MEFNNAIALGGLILAFLGAFAGIILWITSRMGAIADKEALDVGALRDLFSKDIDRVQAVEENQRQSIRNDFQKQLGDVQAELRQQRDQSATRPELNATETRLTVSINKIEQRMSRLDEKLEAIPGMQAQLTIIAQSVEKMAALMFNRS